MPTGKVKWYDTEKGFGFLTRDDGGDVFVHRDALPQGVEALKPGSRVEFGIVDGRRGEQALTVTLLEPIPSVSAATRKPADDMAIIVEDLIKLLDNVGNSLRRGRYPDKSVAKKTAAVLRAVASDLEG
ncbi:MAG: cold-shock protein [Actinomycetes bacterium]